MQREESGTVPESGVFALQAALLRMPGDPFATPSQGQSGFLPTAEYRPLTALSLPLRLPQLQEVAAGIGQAASGMEYITELPLRQRNVHRQEPPGREHIASIAHICTL